MKIKNFAELAVSDKRRNALQIMEAGLQAIDTGSAIDRQVLTTGSSLKINSHNFNLPEIERIFIVGAGKCSFDAAKKLEEILGDRITGGVTIDIKKGELAKVRYFEGDHPFPSERNREATGEILRILENLTEKDLVIFIVSGGGSTLLCQPTNFKPEDEKKIFAHLSENGVDIKEMNTLRKHISFARGGLLSKHAYPAQTVSLIFSDVPGDDLQFISSGPTVKDETTKEDADRIIEKYGLRNLPGLENLETIETPKEDKYFEKGKIVLIVSNGLALQGMGDKAKELGYEAKILTSKFQGEADSLGEEMSDQIRQSPGKTCLLWGGESTVRIKGSGRGGRNQELILSAMRSLDPGALILSFASDGKDNGEVAGALCDIITKEKQEKQGLGIEDSLKDNDSATFFEKVGDQILTGETGSNVSDLVIAIKE